MPCRGRRPASTVTRRSEGLAAQGTGLHNETRAAVGSSESSSSYGFDVIGRVYNLQFRTAPTAKRMKRISLGIVVLWVLLLAPAANAQVATLGKGWLLDSAGSITSTPGEVIS